MQPAFRSPQLTYGSKTHQSTIQEHHKWDELKLYGWRSQAIRKTGTLAITKVPTTQMVLYHTRPPLKKVLSAVNVHKTWYLCFQSAFHPQWAELLLQCILSCSCRNKLLLPDLNLQNRLHADAAVVCAVFLHISIFWFVILNANRYLYGAKTNTAAP